MHASIIEKETWQTEIIAINLRLTQETIKTKKSAATSWRQDRRGSRKLPTYVTAAILLTESPLK